MKEKAIYTAKMLCDTIMRQFPSATSLPPEGRFFYHQGVFLSGMMNTYELCFDEKYYDYVKAWVDSHIQDGKIITNCSHDWLDDIQPGILLFPIYNRTHNEEYKKALSYLVKILRGWNKNKSGGFWHAQLHQNQMWLDSLYMASPLLAQYSVVFNETDLLEEAAKQAMIMYDNMRDLKTGLMFHAWDESQKEAWSNKNTGLSSEIWGRALGWYVVALADIIDFMPETYPYKKRLTEIERELLQNIIKYRDEKKKLWYQVVDKGSEEGNWIENSCSFLFVAAIAKAIRTGILDEKYKALANESFEAGVNNTDLHGNDLLIDHVCIGTCVFDYQGYINRPVCVNDLHGCGAFLLMCSEIARIN